MPTFRTTPRSPRALIEIALIKLLADLSVLHNGNSNGYMILLNSTGMWRQTLTTFAVLSRMFLGPIKRLVSRTDWGQRIEYSLSLSKFHVENHMTSDRHSMWNQKAGNAGIRATSVADFSNDSSSGSLRAPIGIALIRFLSRQIAKVFHCGLEVLVNFLILRIDWPIVYGTQRVKISFQRLTNNRY